MSNREYQLGEVVSVTSGFAFSAEKYKDSGSPIVKIDCVKEQMIDVSRLSYFDPKDYLKNLDKYIFRSGDIAVASVGCCGRMIFNQTDKDFYLAQNLWKLDPNPRILNKKWLFHFLQCCPEKINSCIIEGSTFQTLRKSNFLKLRISIPSLETQEEIVKKLDKFMELNRELILRRQQHDYHRSRIFEDLNNRLI